MNAKPFLFAGWRGVCALPVACLVFALSLRDIPAQSNIVIVEATRAGVVSWTAPPYVGGFAVEWAPAVTGPWARSWDALTNIPNTGAVCSAQVPVFYRVVARPGTGLLLHGDGTNNSTAIVDARGHAVTVRGQARLTTASSRFGGASIAFNGSDSYLDLGIGPDWGLGTGDFTVDLWANFTTNVGTMHLVGLHTSGTFTEWSMVFQGTLKFYVSGLVALNTDWVPIPGQWHHLAVTRTGGMLRLFVDGRLVQSAPNVTNLANNRNLTVGAANNPALYFRGFMDEVHLLKGRALWTNDFAPPDQAYVQ